MIELPGDGGWGGESPHDAAGDDAPRGPGADPDVGTAAEDIGADPAAGGHHVTEWGDAASAYGDPTDTGGIESLLALLVDGPELPGGAPLDPLLMDPVVGAPGSAVAAAWNQAGAAVILQHSDVDEVGQRLAAGRSLYLQDQTGVHEVTSWEVTGGTVEAGGVTLPMLAVEDAWSWTDYELLVSETPGHDLDILRLDVGSLASLAESGDVTESNAAEDLVIRTDLGGPHE